MPFRQISGKPSINSFSTGISQILLLFFQKINNRKFYTVPYKKPTIEKVIFPIGEVADMIGENTSLIRYWENQFDILKPQKNKKGNRLFSKKDIETVKLIHHLVKERGLTIKGAKQKLKENREETIQNFEIVKRLQEVKKELIGIRDGIID